MKDLKYIFVTGGVCSSLGKGIACSSIGALLETRGLEVAMVKVDPYINLDAGTMSPFQHGEVFVTDDGAETDLDLGNYERFTKGHLSRKNSITTGQIYEEVIERERKGDYLGKCVQVIPHITDEIKRRIKQAAEKETKVIITEIGGTVGDIESVPFLEAARQFITDVGKKNVLFVHLTLVPKLHSAGELKTKPTQHSVQKLREIGIQPDILLCRVEEDMTPEMKKKIALFTNVAPDAIIDAIDIEDSIYEVPVEYDKRGLTSAILSHLELKASKSNLTTWQNLIKKIKNPKDELVIGVAGKYIGLKDAYTSIYEALEHAGFANEVRLSIKKIDSEKLTAENAPEVLSDLHGILIPGGFGERGIEGKVVAANYARLNKLPYFGICLGMQVMVIEYARSVLGYQEANSTEFNPGTEYPVVNLLEEQEYIDTKGGTMRLGAYDSVIKKDTILHKVYKTDNLSERHRHRYEFNNKFKAELEAKKLIISCTTDDEKLVESVEWDSHPFGVGVQFHPEFKSNPHTSHPIFKDFIRAALDKKKKHGS